MKSIYTILKHESTNRDRIHLHRHDAQMWRAYEISAYILSHIIENAVIYRATITDFITVIVAEVSEKDLELIPEERIIHNTHSHIIASADGIAYAKTIPSKWYAKICDTKKSVN